MTLILFLLTLFSQLSILIIHFFLFSLMKLFYKCFIILNLNHKICSISFILLRLLNCFINISKILYKHYSITYLNLNNSLNYSLIILNIPFSTLMIILLSIKLLILLIMIKLLLIHNIYFIKLLLHFQINHKY